MGIELESRIVAIQCFEARKSAKPNLSAKKLFVLAKIQFLEIQTLTQSNVNPRLWHTCEAQLKNCGAQLLKVLPPLLGF